jgi:hypothetical protein
MSIATKLWLIANVFFWGTIMYVLATDTKPSGLKLLYGIGVGFFVSGCIVKAHDA